MEDTPKGGQSCRASTDQARHSQRRPPRIASRKTGFHPPGCTHREMRRAEGPVPAAIPHGRQSRDLQLSPEQGVQRTAPPPGPNKDHGGSPGPGSRKAGPSGP